jgi:hypothetical protein
LAAPLRTGKGKIQPDQAQARAFAQMTAFIDNKECRDALNRLWLAFHQHRDNDEFSS